MTHIADMIIAHPRPSGHLEAGDLAAAIEACLDCVASCGSCADACLGEESIADLRHCIRTDQDCADICLATARMLQRQGGHHPAVLAPLLEACLQACRNCAEECERHASMHDHCRICAEACRRCEAACSTLLETLRTSGSSSH
ncbi:four-helix bundle copper-binding protein [Arthrobacter tumbae]|uniref:four-helix bundle copper-binding protein n=1 Tax=Arthrobacter tumbae TaxID=163874 RepID=UPI00195E7833|nr:four-helix bundle copper-binding protein [Arthrobacter tumbae]MBM7780750.1 hypothetical protein [Arthrobacter tumbae]